MSSEETTQKQQKQKKEKNKQNKRLVMDDRRHGRFENRRNKRHRGNVSLTKCLENCVSTQIPKFEIQMSRGSRFRFICEKRLRNWAMAKEEDISHSLAWQQPREAHCRGLRQEVTTIHRSFSYLSLTSSSIKQHSRHVAVSLQVEQTSTSFTRRRIVLSAFEYFVRSSRLDSRRR